MDLVERMELLAADTLESDLIYSRAGVALPRRARARTRASAARERRHTAPTRYSVHSFSARSPHAALLLEDAYRLRARVFMGELGWLAASADGRERDRCDPLARHFALFTHPADGSAPTLAGYARVLLPRHGFMLQREFSELLGDLPFAPDDGRAFEVSRFVIHPALRGWRCGEGRTITERLAREIARWARAQGRDEWYTVCEARYLRALRLRGLEFTTFGQPVEYQPGVEARAAVLRLSAAAHALRARRPGDYAWYTRPATAGQERPR
jgi:N-acyl-L-homoserine lactone synthetase